MTPDLDAVRAMMEGVRSGRTPGSPHQWTVTPVHRMLCDMLETLAAEIEANRATIAGLTAEWEKETAARVTAEAVLAEAQTTIAGLEARVEALTGAGRAVVEHDAFDPQYLSADLNAKLGALRAALSGGTPDAR